MKLLDDTILRNIGALSRSIHSINDIYFKKYHLQRSQFIFLTRICENPGINQISLSNMLKVDKATTTKAVQKLMAEGYVTKERNAFDKREWNLYPSEKARQVYIPIIAEENRDIAICFSGFNDVERQTACTLLERMTNNIGQEWKKYKSYKV
ncbi:MarR family winged helix-turn-helix transcriptional regulator [Megasphaera paucivorans]|uniref:MarR family winged helix-turn-helix transcriptional regulator n=1 Tax=Megasphaera paucivorans TaxID=349095 RepID=UPI003CF5A4E6